MAIRRTANTTVTTNSKSIHTNIYTKNRLNNQNVIAFFTKLNLERTKNMMIPTTSKTS